MKAVIILRFYDRGYTQARSAQNMHTSYSHFEAKNAYLSSGGVKQKQVN